MNMTKNIEIEKIDISIQLLKQYIKETSIEPVITVLEALKKDPYNEALSAQLSDEINKIGTLQGAILTYAPYVSVLLSDDLFEDN